MYKYTFEIWFYRGVFLDKDNEYIDIVAKNEKEALLTLRNTLKKYFFAPKIISIIPIS